MGYFCNQSQNRLIMNMPGKSLIIINIQNFPHQKEVLNSEISILWLNIVGNIKGLDPWVFDIIESSRNNHTWRGSLCQFQFCHRIRADRNSLSQFLLFRFLSVRLESVNCFVNATRRRKKAFQYWISSNSSCAMSFLIAACICSKRRFLSGKHF